MASIDTHQSTLTNYSQHSRNRSSFLEFFHSAAKTSRPFDSITTLWHPTEWLKSTGTIQLQSVSPVSGNVRQTSIADVAECTTVPSQSSRKKFFTSYWNGVKNGKLKSVYLLNGWSYIFFVNGQDMQIRILHANTIFSYFSDMRLNFYSHNKKNILSRKNPR